MSQQASRRVYLETFGCQMNDYDSARMLRLLQAEGYEATADPAQADLIIFNTCSVREKAETKALGRLGRLKGLSGGRRRRKFVLAGCFAQRAAPELLDRLPFVDLALGTDAVARLPQHLRALDEGRGPIVDVAFAPTYEEDVRDFDGVIPGKGSSAAAFVTIMRGCDNFCAYCVVPYVRGRERSRPASEVVREVRQLVARGVREITLLGQNVNSYGRGLPAAPSFPELLRLTHEVDGLARLRFTTSHPKDMTDELGRAFAELPKLASHVHLPVQSGSDAVLRRMGRGYDVARYLDRVAMLRAARPDIAITTDLLVGFPGETEADFAATMALAERVRWSNAFSFRYSSRPGTAAAKLADDVPDERKIARLIALQTVLRRITVELHQELVGREVRVLVEKKQEDGHAYPWSGKSGCYREIHFQGDGVRIGDLATVACEKAFANHLFGRAVGAGAPRA